MNIASPWSVQIAMLPVRRQPVEPDEATAAANRRAGLIKAKAICQARMQRIKAENATAIRAQLRRAVNMQHLIDNTGCSEETVRKTLRELKAAGQLEVLKIAGLRHWRMVCH